MIPSGFPCKAACSACCQQPLELLRVELEGLKKIHDPGVITEELHGETVAIHDSRGWCPWIDAETHRCTIYEDRPVTCRSYGQHVTSLCREGVECPPDKVLPEHVVEKESLLCGSDKFIKLTPVERQAYYRALPAWRARLKLPLDAGPSALDEFHRETFSEEFRRQLVWLKAQSDLDRKNRGAVTDGG